MWNSFLQAAESCFQGEEEEEEMMGVWQCESS